MRKLLLFTFILFYNQLIFAQNDCDINCLEFSITPDSNSFKRIQDGYPRELYASLAIKNTCDKSCYIDFPFAAREKDEVPIVFEVFKLTNGDTVKQADNSADICFLGSAEGYTLLPNKEIVEQVQPFIGSVAKEGLFLVKTFYIKKESKGNVEIEIRKQIGAMVITLY